MLLAEASSAICVQRFDDSRNSAIHTTYRISLRSSSLREPRYPLLRVVLVRRVSGQAGHTVTLDGWFEWLVKKGLPLDQTNRHLVNATQVNTSMPGK